MAEQVVIAERFNGPPASGHGGYSCAMAAQFIDGPAEVSLRAPPPLERPLTVERAGGAVRPNHPFGTCFVCGTGDGMRLFPGPLADRAAFAAPWTPDHSLAGHDGSVRFEFVWSALDCPGGNSIPLLGGAGPCVLARGSS